MIFSKRNNAYKTILTVLLCLLCAALWGRAQGAPVSEEAKKLVAQMTLEEKLGIIVGDGNFVPGFVRNTQDAGQGMILEDQRSHPILPRLSIRTTAMSDGPAGLNREARKEGQEYFQYTTAFPTSTCLAATWNMDLVLAVGEAFGNEVLEYDYELILAPGVNLHRNPHDGRVFEYYSEDPLLSGKSAAAMILGLQSNGIGATPKHFLAHNQQTDRRTYNAVISQRALREIYLRGFEIAVKEGQPKCIMTSYNRMNGLYTAENPELLQTVTCEEWGFNGFFITDFDGLGSSVAKVRAGHNLLMSGNTEEYEELKKAIESKSFDEALLDERLARYIDFKLDSPRSHGHKPSHNPDLEAHAKIAEQGAKEGMVLLENKDNCLPLKGDETVGIFGKTSYAFNPYGTGSGEVRSLKHCISVYDGLKAAGLGVLEDMKDDYLAYIEKIKRDNLVPDYFDNPKMRKDNGIVDDQAPRHFKNRLVAFSREKELTREEISAYCERSATALITFGRSAGENYENGYLPITEREHQLLRDISEIYHSAGKKVIVVLNVVGVWETASWSDLADAILMAWLPGQEGGTAVAEILTGAVNPSGKLPDSFPLKYEDVPSAASFPGSPNYDSVNSYYNEGIYVGYRYYDSFNVPTAYPFGFGLSYTTFSYSDLKLSADQFQSKLQVSVTVENTGSVAGKEIVQLYLAAPTTQIEKPQQELKGFAKTVLLQPGEREVLHFELDERALASFWSGISAWVADQGSYEVRIGASSQDIRLKASFELAEDIVVEKVNDVLYPNVLLEELSRSES
ncbi:MAG: beta-glucosidase [Candidatus Hydrogenedentes bacterium]|nr:beta-glucosidase [Candidatus Hydrogenedentota bacterium]